MLFKLKTNNHSTFKLKKVTINYHQFSYNIGGCSIEAYLKLNKINVSSSLELNSPAAGDSLVTTPHRNLHWNNEKNVFKINNGNRFFDKKFLLYFSEYKSYLKFNEEKFSPLTQKNIKHGYVSEHSSTDVAEMGDDDVFCIGPLLSFSHKTHHASYDIVTLYRAVRRIHIAYSFPCPVINLAV